VNPARVELTLKSLAFRSAKHVLLSSLSLMVRSLLRRYCAQVIHCIQILMLLALTPIGFLRLNPIDLHQRKLLCEFTTMNLRVIFRELLDFLLQVSQNS
ncbi:hypothetical protein SELSPUOL_01519, partial [Selenomonas sputigena ATCC 35185]